MCGSRLSFIYLLCQNHILILSSVLWLHIPLKELCHELLRFGWNFYLEAFKSQSVSKCLLANYV